MSLIYVTIRPTLWIIRLKTKGAVSPVTLVNVYTSDDAPLGAQAPSPPSPPPPHFDVFFYTFMKLPDSFRYITSICIFVVSLYGIKMCNNRQMLHFTDSLIKNRCL